MTNDNYGYLKSTKIPDAMLISQGNGTYYFMLKEYPIRRTPFIIPSVKEVLGTCKKSSKKPPTIYIIFRRPIQKCLQNLGLKIERKDVSKISSVLWRKIDPVLKNKFEDLYRATSEQWRRGKLIFEFFTPLIEQPTENVPENENEASVEKKPDFFECVLSSSEERVFSGQLFSELAYNPGYNHYLGSPSP